MAAREQTTRERFKAVHDQTEAAGHSPELLMTTLYGGLESREFNEENLPRVLELVSRHTQKGRNPVAIAAALRTEHLPPTPENIKALKEAETHILRAYDFLREVKIINDHKKVAGPLFAYILKTHKTLLPQLGEKDYWKHIKVYANQLKANKTSVKVT